MLDRETGKICAMIKCGSEVAVHELPDWLATATKQELQDYLEKHLPEVIDELKARVRKKRQTTWKKARE